MGAVEGPSRGFRAGLPVRFGAARIGSAHIGSEGMGSAHMGSEGMGSVRSGRAFRRGMVAGAALAVPLLTLGGLVHVASGRLLAPAGPPSRTPVRVGASPLSRAVRLSGARADDPGLWGVAYDGGYMQVGKVLFRHNDGSVSRRTVRMFGEPPAGVSGVPDGMVEGLLERCAFPADADLCRTVFPTLEVLQVPSEIGDLPLWHLPAADRPANWAGADAVRTAFVGVHGRGMPPSEWLRAAGTVGRRGMPWFSVSYRNDPSGPRTPDGRMHLGSREADDLWLALRHIRQAGFDRVILAGMSLGGAVIANLLSSRAELSSGRLMLPLPGGSVDASGRLLPAAGFGDGSDAGSRLEVAGLMFEAPALDWPEIVAQVASGLRLPRLLAAPTLLAARLRGRLPADALVPLVALDRVLSPGPPMLVVHGVDDQVVPVAVSDRLVAAAPHASYLRLPGVGHAQGFNRAPQRFFSALDALLSVAG